MLPFLKERGKIKLRIHIGMYLHEQHWKTPRALIKVVTGDMEQNRVSEMGERLRLVVWIWLPNGGVSKTFPGEPSGWIKFQIKTIFFLVNRKKFKWKRTCSESLPTLNPYSEFHPPFSQTSTRNSSKFGVSFFWEAKLQLISKFNSAICLV